MSIKANRMTVGTFDERNDYNFVEQERNSLMNTEQ